jgi:hypothetical protein
MGTTHRKRSYSEASVFHEGLYAVIKPRFIHYSSDSKGKGFMSKKDNVELASSRAEGRSLAANAA